MWWRGGFAAMLWCANSFTLAATTADISATASKPPLPIERVATDGLKKSLQPRRECRKSSIELSLKEAAQA